MPQHTLNKTDELDWELIQPKGERSLWVLATKKEIHDLRILSSKECQHPSVEIRDQTTSNGSIQRKKQCLTCGLAVSNPVKIEKEKKVPKWDVDLNLR